MTRIGLVFIAIIFLAALGTILAITFESDSQIVACRLNTEWYRAMRDDAINEVSSLKQELEIEKVKNAEKDSILLIYKENMKAHSMGLQDANWRLIQLKKLIESQ